MLRLPHFSCQLSFANRSDSGVPGELRGLQYLHKQYGLLPWRHVLAPVVSLAREGFEVTQDLVNSMVDASRNSNFLMDNPAWAMDFAPNGTLLKLGDIMTRKRYANTLEVIAQEGVDAFYTGSIAKATIAAIKATNGIMTMGDLKNYTVAIRQPLSIKYHKYKLVSTSAPSSGAVALSALNTVSGYDGFFSDPNQLNLSYHRLNEAIRFAYAQRTKMGDPSFVPGMDRYTMDMISMANGDTTRSKISDFRTFNVSYYDPEGLETVNTPGTSHIVSADISGLAISMTTTINLLFGSQVMVPETGVILNNEMNDFSIPDEINAFGYIPSPSNYISPGKRPLSSISPIMAELPSGKLYLAIGAAGGSHIATTNVQNAIFILSGGLTTSEALARPRFHDQLNPNLVQFEWTFDNATVAYLQNTGANIGWISPDNMSAAQAIRLLHNGTFESASDPRQSSSCAISV